MTIDIKNDDAPYLVEARARAERNKALFREQRQTRRHGPVRIIKRGVNPNPDPLPEGGLTIERRRK